MTVYDHSSLMSGTVPSAVANIEAVFGAADTLALLDGGAEASIATVRRDIASVHHLHSGSFTFRARTEEDVSVQNLTMHVVLLLSGDARIDYMKTARNLQAGDIMLVSNWTPFQITASGADALVVNFPAWWAFKKIQPSFLTREDLFLPHDLFCVPAIHVLVRDIFERDLSPLESTKAVKVLSELLRSALEIAAQDDGTFHSAERIGRILAFISQNVENENVSPQDAATALKCSLRTIHKTCSDHGTSFNNLLMEIRISAASYMLSTSKSRISEIAFACGFGSLSHFCRLFKARLGESATQYRKRYLQQ